MCYYHLMRPLLLRAAAIGLLLALLFIGSGSQRAYACSCGQGLSDKGPDYTPTAAEKAQGYDAVFSGRVLGGGETPKGEQDGFGTAYRYLFAVDQGWEGVDQSQVYVYSNGPECCVCGFPFSTSSSYLVYAGRTSGGKLTTTICDPTKSLGNAAQDLRELGPGKKPVHEVSLPNPGGPARSLAPVLGGAALAALTILVIRSRIRYHKRTRNM